LLWGREIERGDVSVAEPAQLASARQHLSIAESNYRSEDGLFHLEEGLALLEEVTLDGSREHRSVALNLLSTYSSRICESVRKLVESDRGLPEPDLQHLFKVLLAFDAVDLALPDYVGTLKINVVKRLIERYYEGYPAEEKQKVLEQLTGMAGGGDT
jgi:hypothetical protein